jgi:hypothetical protein
MKTPLIALVLLTTLATTARPGEFLSPQEKKDILARIDDSASDSWDESDAEYAFVNVTCESETARCTVFYRSRYQGKDKYGGGSNDSRNLASHPWRRVKACVIENVHSAEELSDVAYEGMDKCISGN